MKTLYLDCFSGISGDMMLGALLDVNGGEKELREGLSLLGLDDQFELIVEKTLKSGVSGTKVTVRLANELDGHSHEHKEACGCGHKHSHDHEHSHEHPHEHEHRHENEGICGCGHSHGHEHAHTDGHGHSHEKTCGCGNGHTHGHSHGHDHSHAHDHPHEHGDDQPHIHRGLTEITALINNSELPADVKETSIKIFTHLANAEAHVHGVSPDEVHFHEVGAVDAIVDIVGSAILFHRMSPDTTICGPVNLGSGFVRCAHGLFPVPAPAVAQILRGLPVFMGPGRGELTTPTGAAILYTICDSAEPLPKMEVGCVGYGLGQRDMETLNALRVFAGILKNA